VKVGSGYLLHASPDADHDKSSRALPGVYLGAEVVMDLRPTAQRGRDGEERSVPACFAYRGIRGRPCFENHQRWMAIRISNQALPKSQPPRMSVAQCSPT
jgi:hypothetical protein